MLKASCPGQDRLMSCFLFALALTNELVPHQCVRLCCCSQMVLVTAGSSQTHFAGHTAKRLILRRCEFNLHRQQQSRLRLCGKSNLQPSQQQSKPPDHLRQLELCRCCIQLCLQRPFLRIFETPSASALHGATALGLSSQDNSCSDWFLRRMRHKDNASAATRSKSTKLAPWVEEGDFLRRVLPISNRTASRSLKRRKAQPHMCLNRRMLNCFRNSCWTAKAGYQRVAGHTSQLFA